MPDQIAPPPQSVTMVNPATGRAADVPLDQLNAFRDQGYTLETPDQHSARLSAEAADSLYGGARGALLAGTAGVARGATLGGSDLAARLLGGEDSARALSGYREAHPGLSFGTELAGALLPTVLSGGAAAPAGLAGLAGRETAAAVGGGIRGALAGGAVEGGLFGLGQGVSELALSQDPLTLEHAAATLSSSALYGAGIGAVAGGALKGVEHGLGSAKRALDRVLIERSEGRAMQAVGELEASAAAHPSGIGTDVEIEYPAESAPGAPTPKQYDTSTAILDRHQVTTRFEYLPAEDTRPERVYLHASSPLGDGLLSAERMPDGGFAVGRTALDSSLRGQGVGTAMYEQMNGLLESKYGKPLMSAAPVDRSRAAENVWARLEQRGLAERTGDRWVMRRGQSAGGAKIPLSSLDKEGLDLAEKVETERAIAARQPVRDRFVELLDEAHKAREPSKEWLSIVGDRNADKYAREQAKVLFNVDRRVRDLLDNRVGLAERPGRALDSLQKERQALDGLIDRGRLEMEQFQDAARKAPETIRAELLAGELPGFKVGKGAISPTSPVIDDIIAHEVQARFPRDPGGALIAPKELQGFEDGRLEIMRSRNGDLRTMIANLERAPHSDRLSQIEAAREALGGRTAPPKAQPESSAIGSVLKMAAHAVPFGGLAEKAAGALGGLRKAVGAGAERVQRAASTFLGKAAPVAGKAADIAPPVATKVLAALRYGEPATDERGKSVDKPESKTLPELYRARADEVRSQVQIAPDGTHQMRPAARAKMAARLSGLGAIDPIAADRLESAGAARIAWLASQLPRRPDMAGLPVGPDTWQPSDAAMRTWTRKAAAAEDPYGVLDRASAGAKARVVPEEIMAMRALQPALLNDYITKVIAGLPDRKERLPYPQRLSLSMLTGRPLDPAMTPIVLRELQGMHAGEPGSAGGTMAPRSTPQFGSVKRSDSGTPAQRRQGIGL